MNIGNNSWCSFFKTQKYGFSTIILIAAIGIFIPFALSYLGRGQNTSANSTLKRTDIPGFAVTTEEESENGIIRFENHCTIETAVTFIDETGRAWKLSADGWNFLWITTDAVGAMLEAHNVTTNETMVFHVGHPNDALEVFPVFIYKNLVADPLFFFGSFFFGLGMSQRATSQNSDTL